MDTKRHLCNSCFNEFAICEAKLILFGDGVGNDNVVNCDSYKKGSTMDLSGYKAYRKVGHQLMRPYIEGESMDGISVAITDTPEIGGMIAVNPKDTRDSWYVAKEFFETNYELV